MKLRIKNTKTTILLFALYQILGAILGLGLVAGILIKTAEINGAILLIFFIAIGLYLFALRSGIILLEKDYKKGITYSIINQSLQIVSIGLGSYLYYYLAGINLSFGFSYVHEFLIKLNTGLQSQFRFAINTDDKEYFFFINVVPIILIYILCDLYKELYHTKTMTGDRSIESTENNIIT